MEKDIERAVVKYAQARGVLVYKFTSPGRRHVPDRLFIVAGRVFFIEFKDTGAKPRPGQLREAEKIKAQGVDVYFVDDIEKGKGVINAYT